MATPLSSLYVLSFSCFITQFPFDFSIFSRFGVKMSQLGVLLQESVEREREARTIFLMDGVDSRRRRRRSSRMLSLKERLGLKGLGCCGTSWGFRPTSTITVREDDDQELPQQQEQGLIQFINNVDRIPDPDCLSPAPVNNTTNSGMNLAAALAAERQFREEAVTEPNHTTDSSTAPGTPLRVSLMRLIEETDGGNGEAEESSDIGSAMCCVCMGRKKGAAFIPCGHTFCRVCSRELWLNRGACPLCNRSILEILDIF